MVEIFPLNGLVYNKEKVKDFSEVIAPPYDVISDEKKQQFQSFEFNFTKLILPESHEQAAQLLQKWIDENVFVKDKEKSIYVYSQTYTINEKTVSRTGFLSLIKLEDFGKGVLPHEKVLEKDLKDRIALIKTTKSNFGIPFLIYSDEKKEIDQAVDNEISNKEPYISFTDDANVKHQMWKVTNNDVIAKIQEVMKDKSSIIADGHHRYTSELRVRDSLKTEPANYGLMFFVNAFNEGMVILPTNRIVFDIKDINIDDFLNKIKEYFDVEEIEDINKLAEKVGNETKKIGIYSNVNNKAYLLTLKNSDPLANDLADKSETYRKLDVIVLHKVIIEKILGITEEQQKNREHINFIKGNEETIKQVKDGNVQFAFFINPPLIEEVFSTAKNSETMPQKSTFFYPKVFSGMVIYKMN